MKSHLITHSNDEIVFKCKLCDSKYSSQEELKNHCENNHKEQDDSVKAESENSSEIDETISLNKSANELEILQKKQEKIKNQVTTWFNCNECNMKFSNKKTLENHKIKHTGARPFQCCVCGSSFGHQFALRAHLKSHKNFKDEVVKEKNHVSKESSEIIKLLNDLVDNVVETISETESKKSALAKLLNNSTEVRKDLASRMDNNDSECVNTVTDREVGSSNSQEIVKESSQLVTSNGSSKKLSKSVEKEKDKIYKQKTLVYCAICSKIFLNEATLMRHLKDKHKDADCKQNNNVTYSQL